MSPMHLGCYNVLHIFYHPTLTSLHSYMLEWHKPLGHINFTVMLARAEVQQSEFKAFEQLEEASQCANNLACFLVRGMSRAHGHWSFRRR